MRHLGAYTRIGIALLLAGAIAAPVFFFVANSVPLTALAFSAILLGTISLLLARSLPTIPPQAARLLLDAGLENLGALLEELGVDAKAIYLPSSLAGGEPRALIPLHTNSKPARTAITKRLTQRMIVEYGPDAEDVGILVTTPGTTVRRLLGSAPGPSSSELEAALAGVLVGALDLASSVQVAQESGEITVNIAGIRFEGKELWIYRSLGTPIASIAASLVAEGLGYPVRIRSEERADHRVTIRLEAAR